MAPFPFGVSLHDGVLALCNTGVVRGAGKFSRVTDALRMELVGKICTGRWPFPLLCTVTTRVALPGGDSGHGCMSNGLWSWCLFHNDHAWTELR